MKYKSIKNHLKPYSIHEKRKTTINHAFASAIAPVSAYSDQYVASAMVFLGQNPNDKLQCVYCGEEAETWDHLVGLVEEGSFRGYGHQIGNLVPCCKKCNSKKGNNKFEDFVNSHERINWRQARIAGTFEELPEGIHRACEYRRIRAELLCGVASLQKNQGEGRRLDEGSR